MEWYERRPVDYKEDTWHLTLAEHGAYTLLLDHYYSNEKPLPDNDRALSSICNCTMDEWLVVKDNVVAFFVAKNGKLRSKKCEKILNVSYSKRRDGAKRAAKYRKAGKSMPPACQPSSASMMIPPCLPNPSGSVPLPPSTKSGPSRPVWFRNAL